MISKPEILRAAIRQLDLPILGVGLDELPEVYDFVNDEGQPMEVEATGRFDVTRKNELIVDGRIERLQAGFRMFLIQRHDGTFNISHDNPMLLREEQDQLYKYTFSTSYSFNPNRPKRRQFNLTEILEVYDGFVNLIQPEQLESLEPGEELMPGVKLFRKKALLD